MAAGMIAAAGAAVAAARRRARMAVADRVWAAYAEARALRYQPGREGWARIEMPRLDGTVGNTPVALELLDDTVDLEPLWAMALARPAAPLKGHVEVTREGLFTLIGKLLGAQDIVLGDDAFDRAFVVKATDEDTARVLFSASVMSEVLSLGVSYLAYDDGGENGHGAIVVARVPFPVNDVPAIDRALALVAGIARAKADEGPYR